MQNEEFRNLHSSQIKLELTSEGGEMDRACSTHGEKQNAHMVLVEKPERYRP
jgi:hypothetical protein